jgi:D-psicose/D-tagatose/L-ribulose 3-epimerase
MQIGYHAPLWTGEYNDAGLRPAIDKTAEAGFDPIEITLMDPDKADAIAVRKMLDDAGLGLTASPGAKEAL